MHTHTRTHAHTHARTCTHTIMLYDDDDSWLHFVVEIFNITGTVQTPLVITL